jgi:hypothetical protein
MQQVGLQSNPPSLVEEQLLQFYVLRKIFCGESGDESDDAVPYESISVLIPIIRSLISFNADAPLERVRLLPYEEIEVEVPLSSSAEYLRFNGLDGMDGKIMEGGRTGVDGGVESLSLESCLSFSCASFKFKGIVGGPITPLPVATTVLLPVLASGAVSAEFAMAPQV